MKLIGWVLIVFLGFGLLKVLSGKNGAGDVSPQIALKQGVSEGDRNKILDAYIYLLKVCPTVQEDNLAISATLNQGKLSDDTWNTFWRKDLYGWEEDVGFEVKDLVETRFSSYGRRKNIGGHTHYFYVSTQKPISVIINAKQESLDFCNIPGTMKDHYLVEAK